MKTKKIIPITMAILLIMNLLVSVLGVQNIAYAEDANNINIDSKTNNYDGFFGESRIHKYEDSNKNGIIDKEDRPVEGFKFNIEFYNNSGNLIKTTQAETNSEGYFVVEENEDIYEFIQQDSSPSYPFPISGNVNPIRIYPQDNQGFENIKVIENENLPGKSNQKRFNFVDANNDGICDYIEYKYTAIYHNIMAGITPQNLGVNANDDYIKDQKKIDYINGDEVAFKVDIIKINETQNQIIANIYKSGVVGEGEAITSTTITDSKTTTPQALVMWVRTQGKEYTDKKGHEIVESTSIKIRDLDLNGEDLNKSKSYDIVLEDGQSKQQVLKYADVFETKANGKESATITGKYEMNWSKTNLTTNTDLTSSFKVKQPTFYVKGVPYHDVCFLGDKDTSKIGQVQFKKVDSEDNSKVLEGAQFTIYNQDEEGNKGSEIKTLTTKEDGLTEAYELPIGKYYYMETKAPEGYEIDNNEYEFEIIENSELLTIEMTNKKIEEEPTPEPDKEEEDKDPTPEEDNEDEDKDPTPEQEEEDPIPDQEDGEEDNDQTPEQEDEEESESPQTNDVGIFSNVLIGSSALGLLFISNRRKR